MQPMLRSLELWRPWQSLELLLKDVTIYISCSNQTQETLSNLRSPIPDPEPPVRKPAKGRKKKCFLPCNSPLGHKCPFWYRCLCRHFFEEVCRTTNIIAFAKSLRSTKEIGVPTKMPCRLMQRKTSPALPFLQGSMQKKRWNRKTIRLSRLLLLPSVAMLCYALRTAGGHSSTPISLRGPLRGLLRGHRQRNCCCHPLRTTAQPCLVFSKGFFSPFPAGKTNNYRLWKVAFFSPPLAQNSPIMVLQRLWLAPRFLQVGEEGKPFSRLHDTSFFSQLVAKYSPSFISKAFFHFFCDGSPSCRQSACMCLPSSFFRLQNLFLFLQLLQYFEQLLHLVWVWDLHQRD